MQPVSKGSAGFSATWGVKYRAIGNFFTIRMQIFHETAFLFGRKKSQLVYLAVKRVDSNENDRIGDTGLNVAMQ